MKRITATILCLCILLSTLVLPGVSASAQPQSADADPVVFLLGYSTADLYYRADGAADSERERVWNLSSKGIADRVLHNLPQALWGLFKALVFKKYDTLNTAAGNIAAPVLEKMERLTMLPDGSSKYDISVCPYGSDIPMSYYMGYRNVYLRDVYRMITNAYGRVYVFVADWRYGQLELARQLDAFIQNVKTDSGKQQVTLFGFSQGGQTISTYLYYYGDKHDVKKAVMETPAIGGTSFTTAILDEDRFDVKLDGMIRFAESYMETEAHYEWLGKLLGINFLKKSILSIAATHVFPIGLYWGSLWDLVPAADYDRLKEKYLDPTQCAALIAASDAYHYEVIPNIGVKLRSLQAQGMDLSIVCNHNSPLLLAVEDGDGILNTANVSGAMVSTYGSHFNADCAMQGTVCGDKTHCHISPSLTVDASTCYLPENTWFIDGQAHGQSDWDVCSHALLEKLLLTDDLRDVHSDPAFPQFAFAQSPADTLTVSFANTGSYVSVGEMTVTNLSASHPIALQWVTVKDTKLKVAVPKHTVLQPGESVTLSVSGTMPAATRYTPVTVRYTHADEKVHVLHSKTFATSCRIG